MIRRFILAVVAAAALTSGALAFASMASAATTVTATTMVSDHPDTTSVSGPACTTSANGPVWANDAYTSQMTAVPSGTPGSWNVTIQDNGSFAGFADPTTCAAMHSSGSFTFLYTVAVTSPNTPSQSGLHSTYTGAVSTSQMVQDFFGDSASTTVTGGDYFASYQNGNYVQTTSGSYGDVVETPARTAPTPTNLHQTVYVNTASLAWGDPLGNSWRYGVAVWNRSTHALMPGSGVVTGGHDTATGLSASTSYCWNVYAAGDAMLNSSPKSAITCFTTK